MSIDRADIDKLGDTLFAIGAVKFGAFRLKLHETNPAAPLSPIYLNFRLLRSFPAALGFTSQLLANYANTLDYELLADIPTGVTPLVAVMTQLANVPMISPRNQAKSYGLGVSIDGEFQPGQRVLLVDDVISGGESKFEALNRLEQAGLLVKDILVVIDRQQGGATQLQERGYNLHALATISDLLLRYRSTEVISEEQFANVVDYLQLKGLA